MWDKTFDVRHQELKSRVDPIRLEESYRHCHALGLDPNLRRPQIAIVGRELEEFSARHADFGTYSCQIFADIYRDLVERNYIFILCDHEAHLITLYSCPEIVEDVTEAIGLRCGISMSEESCGTNAVALALRYREPMATNAEQHYCRMFLRWCAVAVPVMDSAQRVVACVAISNCTDVSLGEKLALAKFVARDIEQVFKTTYAQRTADLPTEVVSALGNCETLTVGLTPRQQQVLGLFAKGMSYKQIARQIGIGSYKTVEEHLDAVRDKLQVSRRRECISRAMALGLLKE